MNYYLISQTRRFLISYFVLILVNGTATAQVIPWERPRMDTSYASLKEELRQQKIELQQFKSETERQQEEIQDLLATANYAVDVVGLMIAVAGIAFGLYLNRLSKQTETAAAKTAEVGRAAALAAQAASLASQEAEQAAKRSEEIKVWINSDIRTIYEKMQHEEVEFIFASLSDDPDSINYFQERLMVAKLVESDFDRLSRLLRKHTLNLGKGEADYAQRAYIRLLIVHFAGKAFFEKVAGLEESVGAVFRMLSASQMKNVGALLGKEMLARDLLNSKFEIGLIDFVLLNLSQKFQRFLMVSIVLALGEDDKIIQFLSQLTFRENGKPLRGYYQTLKEILEEVGHNLIDEDLDFNLEYLIEEIM